VAQFFFLTSRHSIDGQDHTMERRLIVRGKRRKPGLSFTFGWHLETSERDDNRPREIQHRWRWTGYLVGGRKTLSLHVYSIAVKGHGDRGG